MAPQCRRSADRGAAMSSGRAGVDAGRRRRRRAPPVDGPAAARRRRRAGAPSRSRTDVAGGRIVSTTRRDLALVGFALARGCNGGDAMKFDPVCITGVGAVTPLGSTYLEIADRL